MLTDNTLEYLLGFKGYMTKSNICLFATVLCLIPENVYGCPLKKNKREMDWQLVASYFIVKHTDIFAVYMYNHNAPLIYTVRLVFSCFNKIKLN